MSDRRNDTERAELKLDAGTLTITRAHGRLYAKWQGATTRYPSTTAVPLETGSEFAGSLCALVENEERAVRARQKGPQDA